MDNLDIELIDLMELLNYTLSDKFSNNWKSKYGERIIKLFQMKILDSLKSQKPLKVSNIVKFFVSDCGYNQELVQNFLKDIDYEIYSPILSGFLQDE